MLPVMLDPGLVAVGLAGAGERLARRRALLVAAGVDPIAVAADCADEALNRLRLLFIAGLAGDEASTLAARARRHNVLVNVEDVAALCDFHVPAAVRQGDLLLTVSTGGKAPGLARLIRGWLERRFGHEWQGRVGEVERARSAWRAAGFDAGEISQRTAALVGEKGWLA